MGSTGAASAAATGELDAHPTALATKKSAYAVKDDWGRIGTLVGKGFGPRAPQPSRRSHEQALGRWCVGGAVPGVRSGDG
jgi:hypothetical protein